MKELGSSSHDLLVNGSYIKQSSSGVYNMLPLGQMVQRKLEDIIRKRMAETQSYETSLSTLAALGIWEQSGRYDAQNKEFFRVAGSKYLLAPTNEEEVTSAVKGEIASYKQLPLRLYQISKKFRNEKRPRGGLLRGREFVMKDLYSFDADQQGAHATYDTMRRAYNAIFQDIGLPYLVAEADSGSIGGSLSHEYHYQSPAGEDTLAVCPSGDYSANVERAVSTGPCLGGMTVLKVEGRDTTTSHTHYVVHPSGRAINPHHLKQKLAFDFESATISTVDLDSLSSSQGQVTVLAEQRLDNDSQAVLKSKFSNAEIEYLPVVEVQQGDQCPSCSGSLDFVPAIEVAHTFYLGTKYSEPFKLSVTTKQGSNNMVEMGCFGIGVSRLISAIAEITRDKDGLAWPKSVAPLDALIVTTNEDTAVAISDKLAKEGISSAWDDRSNQIGQLLSESLSLGFPLVIVAGNKYTKSGQLEIEQRQNRQKATCTLDGLGPLAKAILDQCT